MIKILFTIDGLRSGGKERRFLALLKQLTLLSKFQCELIIFNSDVHYKEVFDLDVNLHFLIRKRKKDFGVFGKVYKVCKDFQPDIIHCWDSLSTLYSIPSAKLCGKKLITSKISDAPINYKRLSSFGISSEICFRFSNLILSNSNAGIKAYRVSNKKAKVIYNGFDFNRIMNLPKKEDVRSNFNIKENNIVTMVASFSKNKNFESFLEAAKLITETKTDIAFVCVGDGILRAELELKYKSNKGIYFLGKQNNVESIMNISDIGILMTNNEIHGEGISNSLMEFMALGVPVIASNNGGNSELIENEISGIILSSNTPELLASTIINLLENTDSITKIGKEAQKRIQNKFLLDKMINSFIGIYQKIVKH